MWPVESAAEPVTEGQGGAEEDEDEDVEKAIAKEVASMKRPRQERRFANCQTDTACLVFISCRPPVDPVRMIEAHFKNIERTGLPRTRCLSPLPTSPSTSK